eukprot:scaffold10511_cov129-Isochrysis_galbana.AAC.12
MSRSAPMGRNSSEPRVSTLRSSPPPSPVRKQRLRHASAASSTFRQENKDRQLRSKCTVMQRSVPGAAPCGLSTLPVHMPVGAAARHAQQLRPRPAALAQE